VPPQDQDRQDTRGATTTSALAQRWLAALLSAAEHRRLSALVESVQPPVTVVNLPDLKSGVLVLDRGDVDAATLGQRLNHLTSVPSGAVLHLVLVGGGPADRPLLQDADRNARNPNRLGVWQLDDGGRLTHVVGRKLALLAEAAKRLPTATPLTAEAAASAAGRGRLAQEETMAFATRLQSRRPVVTWMLCAANIVLFVLSKQWAKGVGFDAVLERMGWNSQTGMTDGEYWRLLSHAFLHGSGLHLAVNLIGLYSIGGFLERVVGWRRFLVLYATSAIAGGLASAFVGRSDMPSVGASGAIWGLLGAGFGLVRPGQNVLPALMSQQLRRQLIPLVVINVGLSFYPGIDKYAHFGGGLMGLALAFGWLARSLPAAPAQPAAGPDPWPLRIAAGVAVALMVAAVATALITGEPWQPHDLLPADVI
jgi:rhomboid protease GluP